MLRTYRWVGARTTYLGARKNVPFRALCAWILSRDGTFLRAEPRWDVLTHRAEMGRSYAPSRDVMFLRAEPRWYVFTRRAEIGRSCSHPTLSTKLYINSTGFHTTIGLLLIGALDLYFKCYPSPVALQPLLQPQKPTIISTNFIKLVQRKRRL